MLLSLIESKINKSSNALSVIQNITFYDTDIEADAYIDTTIRKSIIYVHEIMEINEVLHVKPLFCESLIIITEFDLFESFDGIFYECWQDILINNKKETHLFQFKIDPESDYSIALGDLSIKGRDIITDLEQ